MYTDPFQPRVVRVKTVIWALATAALLTLGYLYPYAYVKQRLDAAEQVWTYINTPVTVDLGDGKKSEPVVRRVFIDQALSSAVQQASQKALQAAPAPPSATK